MSATGSDLARFSAGDMVRVTYETGGGGRTTRVWEVDGVDELGGSRGVTMYEMHARGRTRQVFGRTDGQPVVAYRNAGRWNNQGHLVSISRASSDSGEVAEKKREIMRENNAKEVRRMAADLGLSRPRGATKEETAELIAMHLAGEPEGEPRGLDLGLGF